MTGKGFPFCFGRVEYFEYGPQHLETGSEFDVETFLEQSLLAEENRLEDELEQIQTQLEDRERIHEETVGELESKLEWYVGRLEELQQGFGSDDELERHLKQRIEEFYNEIRVARRQAWRDKQELERERRELLNEVSELEEQDILRGLL